MLILVPSLVASTLFGYVMPTYTLLMPYLLMPYLYAMPLAMPAPLRQALTPSPKAVMQLLIYQSSPIALAKDPNLIMS